MLLDRDSLASMLGGGVVIVNLGGAGVVGVIVRCFLLWSGVMGCFKVRFGKTGIEMM